jgi:serpin B
MRRIALGFSLAVLGGLAGCGNNLPPDPGPPPVEWSADMQAMADGGNRFALDLYAKLREEKKGNLFFSPYSAHTALAMTAAGAKGTTRDQMVKVLHLPADEGKALAAGDMGRFYAHPRKDYELSVANALWGQKGLPWKADFLALQNDRFGAGFHEADFRANPDAERERINKWVEAQTRDKIKDLLQKGTVDASTRMVLTNAVYFKGKWATEFKKDATRDGPFHLADGSTVQVPFMSGKVKGRAAYHDGLRVLELPYKGGDLSMVIVLPAKPDDLPAIEKQLTADALAKWLDELHETEWVILLPRFKVEQEFDLPVPLQALGMTDAFTAGKADFSGMTNESLYVSAVVHKAFVDVNEE